MKKFVSTLAVLSLAGIAAAQPANPNQYRLDLFLVLRNVSTNGTLTDVQTGGMVNATPGQTYRVEIRYRIDDGDLADNLGSRGLTAANISITGGTVTKAGLSADQGARADLSIPNSAAPANPDSSAPDNSLTLGLPELGAPRSGVTDPFRGGIGGNDNAAANGVTDAMTGIYSILPLSLASPGQNSFTGLLANNNNSTIRWALYAFNYTYTGGNVTLTASAIADPTTMNRFAFWSGGTTPTNSTNATDGTISFVPAPGAAALLGLGGLIAGRRRRA